MASHTPQFYKLRLELARQLDYPRGDSGYGYELVLPLTRHGHLDADHWAQSPAACRIRRFRPHERHADGHLARDVRGRWRFAYDSGTLDEQPGFHFGDDHFVTGEYISIREDDGRFHHFRIAAVEPH